MTLPLFITRIRSAFLIVESLCATINEVLPFISISKACWIFSSVRVSIDDVASSRMSMGG